MPILITRELAFAAGLDEGNRSMRTAGRTAWNEEDARAAWDTSNRLWPHEQYRLIEPGYIASRLSNDKSART